MEIFAESSLSLKLKKLTAQGNVGNAVSRRVGDGGDRYGEKKCSAFHEG
jgi:hypothetical protein